MPNTLEFSGKIEEGVIRLLKEYKEYENSYARITIVLEEVHNYVPVKKEKLKKAFQGMKDVTMFGTILNPTSWQKQIRDEWE